MNGNRTKRSPKKLRTDEQPRRTNFRFVSREERQPEPMRPGGPFGNSRDREPACKPASLGRQR